MRTRVHQIFASGTSTGADNVANIMVPYSGVIVAAALAVTWQAGASGHTRAELSFQSANQLSTNDATSQIIRVDDRVAIEVGGGEAFAVECVAERDLVGLAIPIDSISKVYAHILVGGNVAWTLCGQLYIATR